MSLARLVVTAVRIEGRTKAEVSRDYGVSPRWVYELCPAVRRRGGGGPGTSVTPAPGEPSADAGPGRGGDRRAPQGARRPGPGCRRPHDRLSPDQRHGAAPSVATIWRILSAGASSPPSLRSAQELVHPVPGRSTERALAGRHHPLDLADGTEVEILNVIDDHSRFLVASDVRTITKAADVVASFHRAAAAHGFPASMLTDNGAVFTRRPAGAGARSSWRPRRSGSATCTPARITPRPAARWSGSTRPRRSGSPSRNQRRLSSSSGPARLVPRLLQRRPRSGRRATNPCRTFAARPKAAPGHRGSSSLHFRVRATRSTSPGRSRCATTRGSTTSGWGVGSSAPGCSCSWPISTSGPERGRAMRRLTPDPTQDYQPHGRSWVEGCPDISAHDLLETSHGGRGGIRTHGGHVAHGGFQDQGLLHPLGHPPAAICRGIFGPDGRGTSVPPGCRLLLPITDDP